MATTIKTLEIISPLSKKSKLIKNSKLIGEALEWMIIKAPSYNEQEANFAIPIDNNISLDTISICSLYSRLGVLFNWTSMNNKNYSVVVLSSDQINFKEIKKLYNSKSDLLDS